METFRVCGYNTINPVGFILMVFQFARYITRVLLTNRFERETLLIVITRSDRFAAILKAVKAAAPKGSWYSETIG